MRILLVNRVFHPDTAGTARFATELCEDLVKAGHQVSVVAGDHEGGKPSNTYSRSSEHAGIQIHRVRITRFDRQRVLGWAVNALSYYPGALWKLLWMPRHDVALFLTDPPMIYALGPLVRWLKGSRFVCWSMDVYPDVAVQAGSLRAGGIVARVFGSIAGWALCRADLVIALGEVMAELLGHKGIPPAKIAVVHNWADGAKLHPIPETENAFAKEHGLLGKYVIAYSGNMGLSHEFSTLLEAARRLSTSKEETIFLFVGSGKQSERLKTETGSLPNVRFLPHQPESSLAEVLSAATVQVVTMKPGMEGTIVPSKFYSALAAARPVLFIGPALSEPAQLIARSGCGIRVEPGDIDGLLAAIVLLRGDASRTMGSASHALFLKEFDRLIETAQISNLLKIV